MRALTHTRTHARGSLTGIDLKTTTHQPSSYTTGIIFQIYVLLFNQRRTWHICICTSCVVARKKEEKGG